MLIYFSWEKYLLSVGFLKIRILVWIICVNKEPAILNRSLNFIFDFIAVFSVLELEVRKISTIKSLLLMIQW